jgi:hypothetical protein
MTDDDLTRSERLDLASRVFFDFRQQADAMDLPAYEYLNDEELMTALLGDMRHYADWRGIDFDRALEAANTDYRSRRNEEEHPYALGQEVEYLQPTGILDSADDGAPVAPRGIVASIYPENDGTQTYHVRFFGETDTRPLKSNDIQPARTFPTITTYQGPVASLAHAEQLLVETSARLRACQLRDVPPSEYDVTDRETISSAVAEACDLAVPDIMRLVQPQVAAWTAEITRPWRPIPTRPAQVSALDFPHPVQQVTSPPGQITNPGPRTAPAQRAHGPKQG